MDLRVFYQKIAHVREMISTPFAVIVSADTPDGGRAGILSEVAREVAAKMIVEGRARLASEGEAAGFYSDRTEATRVAQEREKQQRAQFTVLYQEDLQALRLQAKQPKD